MNISGLMSQFRNEGSLRYGRKKKLDKNYSAPDVAQFKLDMIAGATIKEAAKKNRIPDGSAYRYVPEQLKKLKNKKLAIELTTKKLKGDVDLTYKAIGKLCGFEQTAMRVIKINILKEMAA